MELERRGAACDVRGTPAGDNNGAQMDTQALIVAACQHTAVIHIFHVNPLSIGKALHVFNRL